MSKTTASFCLRESQIEALDDLVRESIRREDVPELSKSEAVRRLLDVGLDESDLSDLLSESSIVSLREERYMADDGDLVNKRTGFETQVYRHFRTRFQNGYTPEQLEEWADNMRAKARAYWPEDVGEDYSDRREQALGYVEEVLREAQAAAETSEYDPVAPTNFREYEGVQRGAETEDRRRRLSDSVRFADDLRDRGKDREAIHSALIRIHDLDPEEAAEVCATVFEDVEEGSR